MDQHFEEIDWKWWVKTLMMWDQAKEALKRLEHEQMNIASPEWKGEQELVREGSSGRELVRESISRPELVRKSVSGLDLVRESISEPELVRESFSPVTNRFASEVLLAGCRSSKLEPQATDEDYTEPMADDEPAQEIDAFLRPRRQRSHSRTRLSQSCVSRTRLDREDEF